MKIKIIGCGNAFSHRNFNQSFLVEENGRKMLIDCGTRTPLALKELGYSISDIDDIYISHAHADHIGGLEEVAFTRYDWMNKPRQYNDYHFNDNRLDYMEPDVKYKKYAPRLIANENLLKELWDYSLRGGLDSMEGFDSSLKTFFEPVPIKANVSFDWEGWNCKLVQQIHIMTGSVIKYTFGLTMTNKEGYTIYFTTDSQHCSPRQQEIFYKKADLIFQDCECIGVKPQYKQFHFGSGVHANYGQLAGYPEANSVRLNEDTKEKMWLSHYQDFVSDSQDYTGEDCDWVKCAEDDGFAGFVTIGQEFDI